MRTPWLLVPVAWLTAGCTVSALSQDEGQRLSNFCSSDSDCGNSHCSDGLCQTLQGQIEALLLTASPPADSELPHLTFVTELHDVPTSGGSRDLTWTGVVSLQSSSLQLPKTAPCYPTFANDAEGHEVFGAPDKVTLPTNVTFSLRQEVLGLDQQAYYATTTTALSNGSYFFNLGMPAGEYDVYFAPAAKQTSCPIPPQLIRGKTIDSGAFTLPFVVSASSTLELSLRWPTGGASLDGWTADIIEPVGGRVISTEVVLGSPVEQGGAFEYSIQLVYSSVVDDDSSDGLVDDDDDLFRLRPPPDVVAPTIYLQRAALDLFAEPGKPIEYGDFTHYPTPVQVDAQLVHLDSGLPISGQVWLSSSQIFGVNDGVFASFLTDARVDADGNFRVTVPPGHYFVHAEPPLPKDPTVPGPSAIDTEWDVALEPAYQAGKLLELPRLAQVSGTSRVAGAQVSAGASRENVPPFEQAFGKGFFLPRASSSYVADSGRFSMQVDPGVFDVSVQPPESSGFAWFVRPALGISGDQDLGRVSMPLPAAISGQATLATTAPLADASIRAYVYLDKQKQYTRDPKKADSVVEVASTRADHQGHYRLLIPERLAAGN